MTFAGLWVDGAVRQPEARHFDEEGMVFSRWKDESSGDMLLKGFSDWHEVYWLDTTPRESLTPEELVSVVKVLWPSVEIAHKHKDASWYFYNIESGVKIDWGNLTQYSPPSEPQWIRITRENVGQYLFRLCRFKVIPDKADTYWKTGRVVGWCIRENCCLVDSDFNDEEPVMVWAIVEVQS